VDWKHLELAVTISCNSISHFDSSSYTLLHKVDTILKKSIITHTVTILQIWSKNREQRSKFRCSKTTNCLRRRLIFLLNQIAVIVKHTVLKGDSNDSCCGRIPGCRIYKHLSLLHLQSIIQNKEEENTQKSLCYRGLLRWSEIDLSHNSQKISSSIDS